MKRFGLSLVSMLVGFAPPQDDGATREKQIAANELSAPATLKAIAAANLDFRANDRDGNRVKDFWVGDVSGLYRIDPGAGMIKTIELSIALADAHPSVPLVAEGAFPGDKKTKLRAAGKLAPKGGYFFTALEKYPPDGRTHVRYDTGDGRNPDRFGLCAYPSEYGVHGNYTFVLIQEGEWGTVFRCDTGGIPVTAFPSDDQLKRKWGKVD